MAEKAAVDIALQANKDHQHALNLYIEHLESELRTVDKMIEAIDSDDDTEDTPDSGLVYVEDAVKPVSVLLPSVLLSEDSPFVEDARWKKRYEEFTTVKQMKNKEHEALREAVRTENMRMQVLGAHSRNQPIDVKAFPPEHFEQNMEGIDWRRVAVKMNSLISSAEPRTPRECEIRWRGYLHPSINHGRWTPEEMQRLRDILTEDGAEKSSRDWVEIAQRLGTNRTPFDCMRHGISRPVHTWTPEADRKLLEAVELYGQNNWQLVAMNVSDDATAHQCQKRYLDSLDPSIKNGPWTPEEEEHLRRAVAAFSGHSAIGEGASSSKKQTIPWQDVALFVPGRTNNQCREHYQDCILKTKGKQKGKKGKGLTKGKGKSALVTSPADEEGDSVMTDISDNTGEASTSAAGKHKSRSVAKTRAKARGKDKPLEEALGEEVPNSPQVAKPCPRPRPRKKASTIVRSAEREEDDEQPPSEAGPAEPSSSMQDTRNNLGQVPDLRPRENGFRRSSATNASKKRKTRTPGSQRGGTTEGVIHETIDDAEDASQAAPPTAKKQKTQRQPGKGNATGSREKETSRAQLMGTQNTEPTQSSVVPPQTEGGEGESIGRRRSARLSKGMF